LARNNRRSLPLGWLDRKKIRGVNRQKLPSRFQILLNLPANSSKPHVLLTILPGLSKNRPQNFNRY
jgi:hypothetical protein